MGGGKERVALVAYRPGRFFDDRACKRWSTLLQIPSSMLFTVLQKYKHEMCIILALDLCVVRDNCQRR